MLFLRCGLLLVVGLTPSLVLGQLRVTEVMYDPASAENLWEWIEVHNPSAGSVDLDGYLVDRLGDQERAELTTPNIRSSVEVGGATVANPTVIPAGGVAVLYNGPGLDYDASRFRSAWPQMPGGAVLIGVDGWASNQLNNTPAPSDLAPSLPGRTFGFWASDAAYRLDALDMGDPDDADNRVVRTTNAAFAFSYDDDDPWPENDNASSIALTGASPLSGSSWSASVAGSAGAYTSSETFLSDPINGADFGSPGIAPPGSASGLVMTEVMYNPASISGSTEWEWVELYNGGGELDFGDSPHWLDDDDGADRTAANVTAGVIPAGGVAVLFNASAATTDQMEAAWQTASNPSITFIPVSNWPGLNNSGDVVGLWDNESDYLTDKGSGDSVVNAAAGVVYGNSSPWPSDNNADSISLANLIRIPAHGNNWGRASDDDPDAYGAKPVFGGASDNSGLDVGSPGFVPDVDTPLLAGDYNGDGAVDAADYTVWRDGGTLLNETASPGVVDSADYNAWRANYGASNTVATTVPEPTGAGIVAGLLLAKGAGRRRLTS